MRRRKYDWQAIYSEYLEGHSAEEIAQRHGIPSPSYVYAIVRKMEGRGKREIEMAVEGGVVYIKLLLDIDLVRLAKRLLEAVAESYGLQLVGEVA